MLILLSLVTQGPLPHPILKVIHHQRLHLILIHFSRIGSPCVNADGEVGVTRWHGAYILVWMEDGFLLRWLAWMALALFSLTQAAKRSPLSIEE